MNLYDLLKLSDLGILFFNLSLEHLVLFFHFICRYFELNLFALVLSLQPISLRYKRVNLTLQLGVLVNEIVHFLHELSKLLVIQYSFNLSDASQVVFQVESKTFMLPIQLTL